MKNMKSLIVIAVLILTTTSCTKEKIEESGELVKVEKNYVNFSEIEVNNGIELILTQGEEEKVEIEAYESIQSYVESEQRNNKIHFYTDKNVDFEDNPIIKIHVQLTDLTEIRCSGGALVHSANDLQLENLSVKASGGSNIDISGISKEFRFDASGGSTFESFDFITDVFRSELSGGCTVDITVNQELVVNASGGSEINYKGEGIVTSKNLSGGSEINKI